MIGLSALAAGPAAGTDYSETNLVSDLAGIAAHQDSDLTNPWGITEAGGGPIWISDNKPGVTTIYDGTGAFLSVGGNHSITIPPPSSGAPPSAPTGVVFNSGSDFGGAHFLFATEDGTIAAWTSGASAARVVDNSASGAVYKGLTTVTGAGGSLLYAANFNAGTVDVFTSSFSPTTVTGGFVDPNIPAGFAPFDIRNIGGNLFVTYAMQDAAKHDDVAGLGHGFVDIFNADGVLQQRLISMGALNSPWGIALAPSDFGEFSNDLLVGNFGDGLIHAYDPSTGALLGTLDGPGGSPIDVPGLWGLTFGGGGATTPANDLFFTAGIPGPGGKVEDHGLFGVLAPIPEPGTLAVFGAGLAAMGFARRRR
jgi:uncharacterized protein (TIGR03118 family)